MPTQSVADLVQGRSFKAGLENMGMDLAAGGQNLLKDIKGGKVGLGAAAGLLGAGAEKLISKNSATANDPFRTDAKQRAGAAVGGAVKGAGKGFDIGNKIIPGLGGAIGAGIGAIGGAFTSRKKQEKERSESVKALRQKQNQQMRAGAMDGDPFSVKAGAGFNTATSSTKAYDKVTRAKNGGERKLPGGKTVPLAGGAVEFVGRKHSEGGIMLDSMTEVEGGETMDKVAMKKQGGKAADYIFSDYLKLGGKTFATRHKEILSRGGSQDEIQELAKLQEKKAGRKEKVMRKGGYRSYQEGGTAADTQDLLAGLSQGKFYEGMSNEDRVKELARAATAARNNGLTMEQVQERQAEIEKVRTENAAKMAERAEAGAREEQRQDGSGRIYGGNEEDNIGQWLQMMEKDAANLPEEFQTFDFSKYKNANGTFDPNTFNTKEEKSKFREWYNSLPDDLVSGKLAADNDKSDLTFGEQWNSRRLLQREPEPQEIPYGEVNFDVQIPEPTEGPDAEVPEGSMPPEVKVNKKRDVPMSALLAGASQLIPPAYALLKKPQSVPGYAPQAYAKPQLPRVNYNAERSSNASDLRATMASIENNAAGPGGMVNMIAAMSKKRKGDLAIADAESKANKQLAAEEAALGQRTSEFNIGQNAEAQRFNRELARQQIADRRQEVLGALDAAADRISGITGDALEYKAQERLAEATSGSTGVLLREELRRANPDLTDAEIAEMAGRMQDQGQTRGGKVKKGRKDRKNVKKDLRKRRKEAIKAARGKGTKSVPQPRQQASTEVQAVPLRDPSQEAKRGGYIRSRKKVRRRK